MAHSTPKIVFGAAGIKSLEPQVLTDMLDTLDKHNVKELDTANLYVDSEETLGKVDAPKRFTIDTKAPGFRPGRMKKENVLAGMEKSLNDLGAESVEIYYLHAPDPDVPLEETLSAIQELYTARKFKRFGISNFVPSDVQKIYDIQKEANSVLPTVFQGNYNAVSRHIETNLFPLLRKLNISFYAYSPIAGGFLVKSAAQLRAADDPTSTRFGPNARTGQMYTSMYGKPSLYEAVEEWEQIAASANISKASLAYRWITFHSALKAEQGDAVIIGASKVSQLEESLKAIEAGPLDESSVARIEEVWKSVEHEAPLDNYNSFVKGMKSRP